MDSEVKILACSDLHGNLPDYSSHKVDIVLIAGDILPLQYQMNSKKSKKWLTNKFKEWIENLNAQYKVFIGGNHDFYLQYHGDTVNDLFNDSVIYLQDNSVNICNLIIYGTPYCHKFGNWAFMASDEELDTIYSKIPNNVDVLLSHDCPYGVNDVCLDSRIYTGKHIGNVPLRNAIIDKQPRYCISGHLHSASHDKHILHNTKCYNVSILSEDYKVTYDPKIFYI